MKRLAVLLSAMILLCLPLSVYAAEANGTVSFDGNKITTDYSREDVAKAFSGMVPGDEASYVITMETTDDKAADWYVKNTVVKSFEDSSSAANGAFSMELAYQGPATTENTLYSSASLGGEGEEGLHQADKAMEDYIYLGRLAQGEKGTFRISIGLDGESQTNTYMNTMADLEVIFAVEPNADDPDPTAEPTATPTPSPTPAGGGSSGKNSSVKTGDPNDPTAYLALLGAAAAAIVIVSVYSRKRGARK